MIGGGGGIVYYWLPLLKKVNAFFSSVYDSRGTQVKYFEEVPSVFQRVKKLGMKTAVTSITSNARAAHDLLEIFGWHPYIDYAQVNQLQKPDQFER